MFRAFCSVRAPFSQVVKVHTAFRNVLKQQRLLYNLVIGLVLQHKKFNFAKVAALYVKINNFEEFPCRRYLIALPVHAHLSLLFKMYIKHYFI